MEEEFPLQFFIKSRSQGPRIPHDEVPSSYLAFFGSILDLILKFLMKSL